MDQSNRKYRRLWKKAFAIIMIASLVFGFDIPEAEAAFGSVGSLGTNFSTSAGTSLGIVTSAQLDAGNIGLMIIGFDNTGTTDADHSEVESVTDTAGNTYTKLREFTNGNGSAGAGATVSVWFTKASANLPATGTATITFANTITSKAATFWEFTVAAGNTIQVATGGATDLAEDADANPGAMTLSGLTSKEYLFVRATAIEARNNEMPATANYTEFTLATADTSNANTSMHADGEFRILTATGDTSDPGDIGASRDHAHVYLALEEVAAGGGEEAPGTVIKVRLRGNVRLVGRLIRLR
ncbi:hypothetical protein C4552_00010 [Candidatus Parcubacteria bacterium]|nr:MAG: hypothetical protein C4552_00010 [Candidatus Parcubacteria bacterium]